MSTKSSQPDRYAVVGNPIAHSLSPQIHAHFAEQTEQNIHYQTLLAPLGGFADAVKHFFNDGGKGVNVTVPFKGQGFLLCTHTSDLAKQTHALNTIWREHDEFCGDTTDGPGLVKDCQRRCHIQFAEAKILIVGAGGTVASILPSLLAENPQQIIIANRTLAKAKTLVANAQKQNANAQNQNDNAQYQDANAQYQNANAQYQNADAQYQNADAPRLVRGVYEMPRTSRGTLAAEANRGTQLSACEFDNIPLQTYDLMINATSLSLQSEMLPLDPDYFRACKVYYDCAYGMPAKPVLTEIKKLGIEQVYDGLGMLVECAALSFFRWRGVMPETDAIYRQLKV